MAERVRERREREKQRERREREKKTAANERLTVIMPSHLCSQKRGQNMHQESLRLPQNLLNSKPYLSEHFDKVVHESLFAANSNKKLQEFKEFRNFKRLKETL